MKKYWFLKGLMVLNLFPALAQKSEIPENEYYAFPSECYYINAKTEKQIVKDPVLASSIMIVDARADSSKLGYYFDTKDLRKKLLCTRTNISDYFLEDISNSHFLTNNPGDGKIFVFLKNLWINNIPAPEKMFRRGNDYELWIKAEYYFVKEERFYPLYRFDSLLISNINRSYKIEDFISLALFETSKKISESIKTDFTNKKWITRQQVDSFNTKNKRLAIFNEKVKKGIFLSVEELKNNTPSITEFSATFSEGADMLYVKGMNISDSAIVDAFAFSDGREIFIKQKANFFQLVRKGNNFEFYGFDNIKVSKLMSSYNSGSGNVTRSAIEAGISGLLSQINIKKKDLQLRVLDIDTGNSY